MRSAVSCLAAALVAMGFTGCGGGHIARAAQRANREFLGELHAAAPDVNAYRSDPQLEGLGHAACNGLAAGASYQQLADRLELEEGSRPLPSEDLGAVITAAVDSYCPRYRGPSG